MKIPKRFKLFNHVITVKLEEDLYRNTDRWGEVRYRRKEIAIDSTIDKGYQEQTFIHELVHLIFDMMSEQELTKNEKLVNTFSELLYQAIETMDKT